MGKSENSELVGVMFDEVPEVLERWYASGIKVHIYKLVKFYVITRCVYSASYGFIICALVNFSSIHKFFYALLS